MAVKINVINKKQNSQVDDFVRDKLELLVGRFAERIGLIDVRVVDENNGRGGEDKICTIDIKLIPRGQMHVRAKNENLYAAIAKAAHRAESVVAKAVERGHQGHEARQCQNGSRGDEPTSVEME